MIIDFHTHIFADKIASKAIAHLSENASLKAFTNGNANGLKSSTENAGIDLSIILPVATKASQTSLLNKTAININEANDKLHSFGTLHPDNENYVQILKELREAGIKGIKLHPPFHCIYADDIRYLKIIDAAANADMIIVLHSGNDMNNPASEYSSAGHIEKMLKQVNPPKLVLAHMGCLFEWDNILPVLDYYKPYIDTSFSLPSPDNEENPKGYDFLSSQAFKNIVNSVSISHVIFGTDSPWTSQANAIKSIRRCGFNDSELNQILGSNAQRLLKLN